MFPLTHAEQCFSIQPSMSNWKRPMILLPVQRRPINTAVMPSRVITTRTAITGPKDPIPETETGGSCCLSCSNAIDIVKPRKKKFTHFEDEKDELFVVSEADMLRDFWIFTVDVKDGRFLDFGLWYLNKVLILSEIRAGKSTEISGRSLRK